MPGRCRSDHAAARSCAKWGGSASGRTARSFNWAFASLTSASLTAACNRDRSARLPASSKASPIRSAIGLTQRSPKRSHGVAAASAATVARTHCGRAARVTSAIASRAPATMSVTAKATPIRLRVAGSSVCQTRMTRPRAVWAPETCSTPSASLRAPSPPSFSREATVPTTDASSSWMRESTCSNLPAAAARSWLALRASS
jgi:hypothetical protein